jgi:homeobox-leucine zipper protein
MLKLAQRMTDNFCAGVCASAAQKWRRLDEWRSGEGGDAAGNGGSAAAGEGEEKVRMMARHSVGAPGDPPGVVLSATTSVRLPATSPQRVFDYLRDEQRRGEWDILANGEAMQEMDHIAKGQHHGNAVSLLRPNVSTTASSLLQFLLPFLPLRSMNYLFVFLVPHCNAILFLIKCSTVPWCRICVYMHALQYCMG